MRLAIVRRVIGLVLGKRGVALAATVPHQEEEDQGRNEENATSDTDAEADFEACVGGRGWRRGPAVV